MTPYIVVPGIRFNDHVFSEPGRLINAELPKCGGIFAILVRDPTWAPKPFQPLCFREFGNNAQNILQWARGANADALFVSVLAMPFSSAAQRCEIRNQLIGAYNPVCQANGIPAPQSEFAHKLDELEKKHEEQTTHVRLLLATINRLFEPQAEPRRRPIGFLPTPTTALSGT